MPSSNKRMERENESVTPFAFAKRAPLSAAAHPWGYAAPKRQKNHWGSEQASRGQLICTYPTDMEQSFRT